MIITPARAAHVANEHTSNGGCGGILFECDSRTAAFMITENIDANGHRRRFSRRWSISMAAGRSE
jgi:hypothetical protein